MKKRFEGINYKKKIRKFYVIEQKHLNDITKIC